MPSVLQLHRRIEDLPAQMTLEEKTCQTASLYGHARVLKDELLTPAWKKLYHFGHGLSYTSLAYSDLLIGPAT